MSQLVGTGPVAEVYAVEGMALKVFPGKFDRRTLSTIERERAKLAELAVPVLPLDGVELVDGSKHAFRMELCADSLASRVRREGPLPSEEVAALCGSLSRALAAAHALGVLHGGITPANVLFRANGEAVLADFGVVQRQEFRRDPLAGIEWVSPETLRTGVVEAATDVYGLGAVLHFALTGKSPHPSRIGELTGERILRVLGDPVPAVSRPDVPIALSTIIGRMLAPDPARRTAPVTADVPETPPDKPARRRWYAALSVVAVPAVVLAVVLWPRATPQPPATNSPPPPITAAEETVVELNEPTDLGDKVALSWSSTDDRLYFAVRVWLEGEPGRTVPVGFGNTKTVDVDPDPARKYCFLVRGTNGGEEIFESQTEGLRGAVCHR
ncbi:serine/threonine protein kinase [Saccharothrix ecbatanensis]|uniref:non-specific serine/threonine protein kinase n=1 Tax=Saccharothrix ecbatanensis TaxID=1105145 RepID=A0A7W9HGU1_9PSEU|nr:serine/threonine-protein kinase [Saccharothrix ecbatanensis]MBB5802008.1 serine/threonine protein kinase [Saccharothrix ecbatanensis]